MSSPVWQPEGVRELLAAPGVRGLLLSASRDPDAKLTFLLTSGLRGQRRVELAVKIPSTAAAGAAIEREGRVLVAIRRHPLHELASTVPRYVESRHLDGRAVLVSTALEGTPMSVRYHSFLHTSRPREVARDLDQALAWLSRFQAVTTHGAAPLTWPTEVALELSRRWDGHPALAAALDRLDVAARRMDGWETPLTAVHGDYWFGNVLVGAGGGRRWLARPDRSAVPGNTGVGGVTGVIDWESGSGSGQPLRDLARFALSYALYLDRHTRPGRRVLGHAQLVRAGCAPGIAYLMLGSGWFPTMVREFLGRGLRSLELPPALWYDVALTGIGEVAAGANSDAFGAEHLALLARLPHSPGWSPRS